MTPHASRRIGNSRAVGSDWNLNSHSVGERHLDVNSDVQERRASVSGRRGSAIAAAREILKDLVPAQRRDSNMTQTRSQTRRNQSVSPDPRTSALARIGGCYSPNQQQHHGPRGREGKSKSSSPHPTRTSAQSQRQGQSRGQGSSLSRRNSPSHHHDEHQRRKQAQALEAAPSKVTSMAQLLSAQQRSPSHMRSDDSSNVTAAGTLVGTNLSTNRHHHDGTRPASPLRLRASGATLAYSDMEHPDDPPPPPPPLAVPSRSLPRPSRISIPGHVDAGSGSDAHSPLLPPQRVAVSVPFVTGSASPGVLGWKTSRPLAAPLPVSALRRFSDSSPDRPAPHPPADGDGDGDGDGGRNRNGSHGPYGPRGLHGPQALSEPDDGVTINAAPGSESC